MDAFLLSLYQQYSGLLIFYGVLLILVLCGLGIPIPEEILLFIVGYLVYQGDVGFVWGSIGALIAIFLGDSVLFFVGFHFGQKIFKLPWFSYLGNKRTLRRANVYLKRHGSRVVFVGRFLAGLRAAIFLTTGILRMPYRRFILFDGLAALLSVPTSIYFAAWLCERFEGHLRLAREELKRYESYMVQGLLTLVLLTILFWFIFRLYRRRKKERLQTKI